VYCGSWLLIYPRISLVLRDAYCVAMIQRAECVGAWKEDTWIWLKNPNERDRVENLGVYRKILLKWVLKR
jgi:hypothetical protein